MKIFIDTPFNDWCHLVANSESYLHIFAREIGLDQSYFRNEPGFPHYDCVGPMIKNAINAGAQRITRAKLVDFMKRNYSIEPV